MAGGTGSGLSSLLLESLNNDYAKVNLISFTVMPKLLNESNVTAFINTILYKESV